MKAKVASWNVACWRPAYRRLHWYAAESSLLGFCGQRERQPTKFDNLCFPSRLNLLPFSVRESRVKSKGKFYRWSKTENLNRRNNILLNCRCLCSRHRFLKSLLRIPNYVRMQLTCGNNSVVVKWSKMFPWSEKRIEVESAKCAMTCVSAVLYIMGCIAFWSCDRISLPRCSMFFSNDPSAWPLQQR